MHQGLRSNDILQMIMKEYKRMIPYEYVHFINVYDSLFENGQLNANYFIDGLHINEDGYQVLTEVILKAIKEK